MKQISKTKIEELGYDISTIALFGKETGKQVREIQSDKLVLYLFSHIETHPVTLKERLSCQYDILGTVSYIDPTAKKNKYFVLDILEKKTLSHIILYEIHSGKERKVKIWNKILQENPLEIKDVVDIISLKKDFKREPTGEFDKYGKPVYQVNPNKFEYWLQQYSRERE